MELTFQLIHEYLHQDVTLWYYCILVVKVFVMQSYCLETIQLTADMLLKLCIPCRLKQWMVTMKWYDIIMYSDISSDVPPTNRVSPSLTSLNATLASSFLYISN